MKPWALHPNKPGTDIYPIKSWKWYVHVVLSCNVCVNELYSNTKLIQYFLLEHANWSSSDTFCVPLTSQFIAEASAQVTIWGLQSHFLCQVCICWHRIRLKLEHLAKPDSYLQFLWRDEITAPSQAKKIISHLYTIKAGLPQSTKWC